MQYQNKILLLSFLASVVLSLIVVPILRKLKIGQIERKNSEKNNDYERMYKFKLEINKFWMENFLSWR